MLLCQNNSHISGVIQKEDNYFQEPKELHVTVVVGIVCTQQWKCSTNVTHVC